MLVLEVLVPKTVQQENSPYVESKVGSDLVMSSIFLFQVSTEGFY